MAWYMVRPTATGCIVPSRVVYVPLRTLQGPAGRMSQPVLLSVSSGSVSVMKAIECVARKVSMAACSSGGIVYPLWWVALGSRPRDVPIVV